VITLKTSNIDLNNAYRFLYPRLTVIVTSGTLDEPCGLTIAWSTPLSVDPPLIGVSITKKRYSYNIISETKSFVVNIPHISLKEGTHHVGRISGREDPNKFLKAGFTLQKSTKISAPRLKECKINIECKLVNIITIGDHDLFIGEVVELIVDSEIVDEWGSDLKKFQPIYWRRSQFSEETYQFLLPVEDEKSE
jgi:flavin reductase (DIM6/NTAB) family NADH-FMN oxidoreductase RutF